MIGDTALLGSPWNGDSILLQDKDLATTLNYSCSPADRVHGLESYFDSCFAESETLQSVSSCTSVASSECSDDLDLYFENDSDVLFGEITSSILNVIHENSVSDTVDWNQDISLDVRDLSEIRSTASDKDSIVSTSSCSQDLYFPSSSSSVTNRSGPKNVLENIQNWENLNLEERLVIVDDLSRIVSSELGIREQLEVIRIINPAASISPTDTEFAIEVESMDEKKLQKIKEYISLHACSKCESTTGKRGDNFVKNRKLEKKLKSQERRSRQKAIKQRQSKDYRQMLKERRSGLFVKEEVMLLSVGHSSSSIEDDDIDILD